MKKNINSSQTNKTIILIASAVVIIILGIIAFKYLNVSSLGKATGTSCIDSDGNNINIRGNLTLVNALGRRSVVFDACANNITVQEKLCTATGSPYSKNYNCLGNLTCLNGACKPKTPTCTNECSPAGARGCKTLTMGQYTTICGESGDGDSCLEWVAMNQCPNGCANGSCIAPRCGDSICNNGETCSSCSADCGSCPLPNSCNDSDATTQYPNGKNYNLRGTIQGIYSGSRMNYTEYCVLDYYLKEYYCSLTFITDETYYCPNGCVNGACVNSTICIPNCTGKQCGDDGCGGRCGQCYDPTLCSFDRCISPIGCYDSDDPNNLVLGIDYLEQGYCNDTYRTGFDVCLNATHLKEHQCTGAKICSSWYFNCKNLGQSYYCGNGACKTN